MKKFIAGIFSEADGTPSSARIAFLALSLALVGVWASVSLHKGALQDIPNGVLTLAGVFAGTKLIHKPMEGKALEVPAP